MRRFSYVMAGIIAVAGLAVGTATIKPVRLIWNATASAPIGFYTIEPAGAIEVPDLVAVIMPEPFAGFMSERGYIGKNTPLLKRVLGVPGQQVCRRGHAITVNGIAMGDALDHDRKGRDLPVWSGCRIIRRGELFLMNFDVPDSFDGRYFGPVTAQHVIGRAYPLLTDEAGDGRFRWRAPTR